MAEKIAGELARGRVLWLICGGSNIPYAKAALDIIRAKTGEHIKNLTVGQTDERFGDVGHKDSNWRQLIDAGCNFDSVQTLPILRGTSLQETVSEYAKTAEDAFAQNRYVAAQFGIGADGHVAGMLPHTGGIEAQELVFGYEAAPFVRITITPPAFSAIHGAYTFAFGESKKDAVHKLRSEELSPADEPCQLLKQIPESYFYSDQL